MSLSQSIYDEFVTFMREKKTVDGHPSSNFFDRMSDSSRRKTFEQMRQAIETAIDAGAYIEEEGGYYIRVDMELALGRLKPSESIAKERSRLEKKFDKAVEQKARQLAQEMFTEERRKGGLKKNKPNIEKKIRAIEQWKARSGQEAHLSIPRYVELHYLDYGVAYETFCGWLRGAAKNKN